jgi:hypothetical protein
MFQEDADMDWKITIRTLGTMLSAYLRTLWGFIITALSGFQLFQILATRIDGGLMTGPGATFCLCAGAVGVLLLADGHRKRKLLETRDRMQKLLSHSSYAVLPALAAKMQHPYPKLVSSLHIMVSAGLFPGAYIDLDRGVFVINPDLYPAPVSPDEAEPVQLIRQKSLYPYLAAVLMLLGFVLCVPFDRPSTFLSAGITTVAVFFITRRYAWDRFQVKPKIQPLPAPQAAALPFASDADKLLTEATRQVKELNALGRNISHPVLNESIERLVLICNQIFDCVGQHPEKIKRIRQFLNYYLPTTVKLLTDYQELSRQTSKGHNISSSMEKIESVMDSIEKIFQKELDDLFFDHAIDISAEIEVLKGMMS